nr:MAG TPA: hypothetical protein [Caudoviricetes sp.]
MRNRLTIANPNGVGYRIPGCRASSLRLEWQQEQTVLFGTVADRLGEYIPDPWLQGFFSSVGVAAGADGTVWNSGRPFG